MIEPGSRRKGAEKCCKAERDGDNVNEQECCGTLSIDRRIASDDIAKRKRHRSHDPNARYAYPYMANERSVGACVLRRQKYQDQPDNRLNLHDASAQPVVPPSPARAVPRDRREED